MDIQENLQKVRLPKPTKQMNNQMEDESGEQHKIWRL